ncbi:MAG: hypothetical protein FJ207_12230 [Gemmatimonadetes bacterium]|nr:hypothetical protein [Gemmatimonadota bacterium]
MSDVIGVELLPDVVRAVALRRWSSTPRRTAEMAWDPARPAELVALLRQQLGSASRIAISVGIGFLHVKQVKLPAVPIGERRGMLALEPDRFFTVQGESLAVSLDEHNLAFAIEADLLERWLSAFAEWGTVEHVEASPHSLARALDPDADGTFSLPAATGEQGVVEVRGGRVHSARRIPPGLAAPPAEPCPARRGVAGEYLCALGAARGVDHAEDAILAPAPFARRIQRGRVRRLAFVATACVFALGLAVWAADRSRERTLVRVREELAALAPEAQPAIELRARLTALDQETQVIGDLAQRRPDPVVVLAALSERLPAGATVLVVSASDYEWRIEGRARDAAAIVPLLDRDSRFQDVSFLSASARFREGSETYETFSIAFRVGPGN